MKRNRLRSTIRTAEFVVAAIRNPLEVSTVFPTSRWLANNLLDHANLATATSIVELGAGTGAITQHLASRIEHSENYLGVELDAKMNEILKADFPQLRFEQGLAQDLLNWVNPSSVDSVISSLPWSVFSEESQTKTIEAIEAALKPGGVFVTYICVNAILYPAAKAFLSHLNSKFRSVQRSRIEWRNIPPAFVVRSVK